MGWVWASTQDSEEVEVAARSHDSLTAAKWLLAQSDMTAREERGHLGTQSRCWRMVWWKYDLEEICVIREPRH